MKRSIILLTILLCPALAGCPGSGGDAVVPVNPDGGTVADLAPLDATPEAPGIDTGTTSPDVKSDTTPPNPNVIWDPARAKALRAYEALGGFLPGPAACNNYVLEVATRSLTLTNSCPSGAPPAPKTRTLSTAQYAMVDAAMAKLSISSATSCGADKGEMTVEVETTDGARTKYWDSFYACMGMGRKYVDMIDELMGTLRTLAQ